MVGKTADSSTANGEAPPKITDDVSPHQTQTVPYNLIIDEVLPRLPVKPLMRFKSVCKSWNAAISSPYFIKSHLKISSSNRPLLIAQINKLGAALNLYYTLPYRARNSIHDLKWLYFGEGRNDNGHQIVDSCKGLVCLYHWRKRDYNACSRGGFFSLWNPATREVRDIVSPDGVKEFTAFGFCYVSSVNDYLIVASSYRYTRKETSDGSTFRGFYVFSTKAGTWEWVLARFEYQDGPLKGPQQDGVMVGDTMYWRNDCFYSCKEFVGFNVVSHEYKEYPIPGCKYYGCTVELFRVKGCLALFCNMGTEGNEVCDLWIVSNPDDLGSWQKILSVDFNSEFLLVSDKGKVLVQQKRMELSLVDPSKEALECNRWHRASFVDFPILRLRDHVESLISPFGTIEADEEGKK